MLGGLEASIDGRSFALDLRERVVATFRSGMSRLGTATLFKVSKTSVQRWARLDREEGDLAAQPMGGHRPFALASERDRVLERIAQQPDLPLRELLAELHDRGIKVSYFAVWNMVDRAGLIPASLSIDRFHSAGPLVSC